MSHKNGQQPAKVRRFDPIAIIGMRGRFPGANDLETSGRTSRRGWSRSPRSAARTCGPPGSPIRSPASPGTSTRRRCSATSTCSTPGSSASRPATPRSPIRSTGCSSRPRGRRSKTPATTPPRIDGPIGVFGGCELSTYLYQLSQNPEALGYIDGMQLMVTNDKDHLCTQVSYRLDLRGPSVVVQTTCSTSLVAVAMACESLQVRSLRHGARRWRDRPGAAARRLLLHRRAPSSRPTATAGRSTRTRRARSSAAASGSWC